VSLTSQLYAGPLGDWCADVLAGTAQLVDQVQAAGRGRAPVRPTGDVGPDHWATVGGAFGQRLAFLVAHEPPYAALLGAARAGLVGDPGIDNAALHFPSHHGLTSDEQLRATELRPTPTGWVDLRTERSQSPWGLPPHGNGDGVIEELLSSVAFRLEDAPPGQLADTREAEADLARACYVFAGWEAAYRGGVLPPQLAGPYRAGVSLREAKAAGERLLATAPAATVDELVTLSGRLHGSGSLDQLRALAGHPPAGQPLGVAAPLFVLHWAEGDVLVGDTLLDVKTVITLRDRARLARWLHQVLAYAWLDEADRYRIRRVGLYLARHGALLTWPLDEFAAELVGDRRPSVDYARREFVALAGYAIEQDTGASHVA
jgi:hypothetical protein